MPKNEVRTDFTGNADSVFKIADSVKSKFASISGDIDNLAKNTKIGENFSAQLSLVDAKAYKLTNSLKDISKVSAGRGFDSMSLSARGAIAEIAKTQKQLSGIRDLAAKAPNENVFRQLSKEAKTLENDLDRIGAKVNRFNERQLSSPGAGKPKSSGSGGGRGRITGEQAALLEILDDFAPTGLNKPFNSVARGALIAGDLKEAATGIKVAGKEMLALVGISGTALATFGAIAAVGYGIVKVTQNIREEAERRLKVENDITAAVNKQIISQREGLQNLQKEREELQKKREFNRFLSSSSLEDLERRKSSLQQLQNLTPATLPSIENGKVVSKTNEDFQKNSELLKSLDAQIDTLKQQNVKLANQSFNQSFINSEKSQNDRIESEKRYNARLKDYNEKRDAESKKAADKLKEEIEKTASSLDNLYQKANSSNPFVSVFNEADKADKSLKDTIKSLSPELQSQTIAMQKSIDDLAVFNTRLDNKLGTLDLRERIDDLRNYTPKFDQSQADEIARRNISYAGYTPGGTFGSDLANRNGGFDKLTDKQKRDIYQVSLLSQTSFTDNPLSTFNALNQKSLISKFASEQLTKNPDENLSAQARLDKQLSIIDSLKAKTPEEQAAADRKALSISSNLRPDQLTDDERNKLITINEREAERRQQYERQAQELRREQAGYLKEIRDHQKKTGGGGEATVRIVDESNGAAEVGLRKSPTAKKTDEFYQLNQFEFQ